MNDMLKDFSSALSSYHMCSQKWAKPLNDLGSDEAPTSTTHDMAVVLLSLSLITKQVTPFSSRNPL
jgi:hypothetical protein